MSCLQPAVGPDRRLHPILAAHVDSGPVLVCCDYDGTLSPIVDDPDEAVIDDDMRHRITRLRDCARVAIISGRALDDVAGRVAVPDVIYAGSHGLDIATPDRSRYRHEPARASRAALDLNARELEPDVDWDKGRAVARIVSMVDLEHGTVLYLGDDTTDEDAFTLLQHHAFAGRDTFGIGIAVGQRSHTAADYALEDPAAVGLFLTRLADRIGGATNGGADRR